MSRNHEDGSLIREVEHFRIFSDNAVGPVDRRRSEDDIGFREADRTKEDSWVDFVRNFLRDLNRPDFTYKEPIIDFNFSGSVGTFGGGPSVDLKTGSIELGIGYKIASSVRNGGFVKPSLKANTSGAVEAGIAVGYQVLGTEVIEFGLGSTLNSSPNINVSVRNLNFQGKVEARGGNGLNVIAQKLDTAVSELYAFPQIGFAY